MSTVIAQLTSSEAVAVRLRAPGVSRRRAGLAASLASLASLAALAVVLGWGPIGSVAGAPPSAAPPARRSPGLAAGGLARGGPLGLPLSARAPISADVGADEPAFRVARARSGLVAANPAQRLRERFGAGGVWVSAGAARVGVSLRGLGYGAALTALGPVAPRARGNRVVYERAGVREWYANGPLGLEQGFTIVRAPAGAGSGPLTLSLSLSGDVHAAVARGAQSVTFSHAGVAALRYSGLSATDASGRVLRSWLSLSGGRLLVRVDARDARYPLRIDPFIHQGEKLTASGLGGPYGYVGMSVALSADGDTALVGAPADDDYTGSAYVFTRSGSTWTQQGAKLTGSGTVGEAWFGESVALSADGDTALVGGPSDDDAAGAAWVFTRSGSTWTQQGEKLTGGGESGEGYFGKSVALSAEGDTALIGGYNDDEHRGAAWVFTRSGSTWTQQGEKLTGSGNLGFFGWSVALSAQANTALIGEWGLGGGVGAALVFTRSGSKWTQQGEALSAGGASGYSWFGYSVALSAEGDTALVGAPHGDGYAGEGLVFARSGSTWTQQGEPLSGEEELGEGELGYSSALSADGSTALLGGRVDDGFHGAAWAFERSGSTWSQLGEKLTGGEESSNREEFGWSVALDAGADTALVGSPCDKACVGSASVFAMQSQPPEYGRCAAVAKGAGRYGSSACTSEGGKLDYEWRPGVVQHGLTTKMTSGSATFETVAGAKVTCTGETGAGAFARYEALVDVTLTLTGCARSGEACTSAGAHAGEVVSSPLEGLLGVVKRGASAAKDKLGVDLFPVGGTGTLLAFTCGATSVSLRGSVIVPVAANRTASTFTLKFKAKKGRQKPEGFAGEAKDVLEASFDGGAYEQTGLSMTASLTSAEAVEIDSAV